MKPHIVEFADFADYYPIVRICGSHNKHENKSIDMVTHPTTKLVKFIVTNKHNPLDTVKHTNDLHEAVKLYNNI